MSKFTVLGLSGRAGVGKDYLFNSVLRPEGYYRVALADHFKIWITGQGSATYDEVFNTKPAKIRNLLQQEGTERGRNVYGPNIWCETLQMWMNHWYETWGINKFCVTDVRFPNEVEFVQSVGGSVIRIDAPKRQEQKGLSPEASAHISETALDFFENFDLRINNDPGESGAAILRAFVTNGTVPSTRTLRCCP